VKVTELPEQMFNEVAEMLTEGITTGFTVMVTALEVAVGVVAHPMVVVITQVTIAPFVRAELV
jgi:hypothetical protein